ncbi:MAG: putative DNA-binding transcriptional regulator YafY [Halocynthiibacter sp.]|jgi:predicted DNA-binding transcriptional regulator YafY
MRRADRLFQIVQYLRGGRLTTAQILAEKLEVSERTIYRDIADLIGSGVPIDGEAGVGYIMRAGYDIPPLMFSKAEITALVAGARILRSFGGAAMSLAAEEALIKIESVLPEGLRDAASSVPIHTLEMGAVTPETRANIDRFETAAQNRLRISFDYLDEDAASTKRTIRPLGLWFWGKVWTVVGWCELRNDFRMFRIDRIENPIEGAPFRLEQDKTLARFYEIQEKRGLRRR